MFKEIVFTPVIIHTYIYIYMFLVVFTDGQKYEKSDHTLQGHMDVGSCYHPGHNSLSKEHSWDSDLSEDIGRLPFYHSGPKVNAQPAEEVGLMLQTLPRTHLR